MKTVEIQIDIPDGFVLCPYPKRFLFDNDKGFVVRWPHAKLGEPDDLLNFVLTNLRSSKPLMEWMTIYSSVKGITKFAVGVENDIVQVFEQVAAGIKYYNLGVRWESVRLLAPLSRKPFKS